ncbi:AI-2E family transporter [Halanaerobacter jeridensis]|uniref:PurR-regulated permease PerM n=1 Tax=Halanaerobacter jeridensis TaxID=706427 RepID=A0A939BNG8_9FIRM|nr:AI-2E family transporter [Halanaerobacter jeridensis]MBM7555218.1 putative PurR-regulated permease PerM [Halanaerobacter jeridensis]
MFKGKFFKITYGIILVLVIIFLSGQVPYIMEPLSTVLSIIIVPLLLGGFFYYLLRPIVRFFTSKFKNKTVAVVVTCLLVIVFIAMIIFFGGSIIYNQIKELISYFSNNYELSYQETKESFNQMIEASNGRLDFLNKFNFQERISDFFQKVLAKISGYNYVGTFSSLTNLGTIAILIPFVIFYLLKDDKKIHKFLSVMLTRFSKWEKEDIDELLVKIDKVLADYIGSQLIVAIILGIIMFLGYLIISLPNAFALALIAMVTSLIPILGPTIGILPALFIALTIDFLMMVKVILVLSIAQYLEGNLVRPLAQGNKLDIHPLIILFIVLISVLLFGVLGALFAVPVYAVLREVIRTLVDFDIE